MADKNLSVADSCPRSNNFISEESHKTDSQPLGNALHRNISSSFSLFLSLSLSLASPCRRFHISHFNQFRVERRCLSHELRANLPTRHWSSWGGRDFDNGFISAHVMTHHFVPDEINVIMSPNNDNSHLIEPFKLVECWIGLQVKTTVTRISRRKICLTTHIHTHYRLNEKRRTKKIIASGINSLIAENVNHRFPHGPSSGDVIIDN